MKKNTEYILKAYNEGYAIPQFNINNLEWAKWVLEECQKHNSPVFIGVSMGAAKYMGGYQVVSNLISGLKKELSITIPVLLHLDHATSVEVCKKAYNAGFDSLMIDGSALKLEDNIKMTNEVCAFAYDTLIEAEIGVVGGSEDGEEMELIYTSKEEAEYFTSQTNIEMLAASLGSVHGIYKGEPKINFEIMAQINEAIKKPLVLHGGSGLSSEIIKNSIKNGVSKINYNTELQLAWNQALRNFIAKDSKTYDPRKVISAGENALKKIIEERIDWVGSKNRG